MSMFTCTGFVMFSVDHPEAPQPLRVSVYTYTYYVVHPFCLSNLSEKQS